jgi:hypothetical protein
MVEQLFTATGEEKGNGKGRVEQLFTVRREKSGNGTEGTIVHCPCHVMGMRTSGVYEQ